MKESWLLLKNSYFQSLVLAVFILAIYSFVLGAGFRMMDDSASIVDNPHIKDLKQIQLTLSQAFFGDKSYYRPLVSLSFMLEYFFVQLQPILYYLTNIFLHVLVSWMVLALSRLLLGDVFKSFLVALIFAIHPIHWEAVANIAGRSILLCALFCLIAFYSYLLFKIKEERRYYLLSLLTFLLALLCKESAVMLPFLLGGYVFFFRRTEKHSILETLFEFLPFGLMLLGYVWLRQQLGITELFFWANGEQWVLGVLSFARGVLTYLRLFIWPVDLHFDRSRIVFTNFEDPQIWATVVFGLIFSYFLFKYYKKWERVIAFALFWFLLELIPVAQIISSIGVQPGVISLAEHFLYLPSIGIFILMVQGATALYKYCRDLYVIPILSLKMGGVGFLCFLFLTTIQMATHARDEEVMLVRSLTLAPYNTRVMYSLAMKFVAEKNFIKAEDLLRKILNHYPHDEKARIALGKALCDQGRYWEGLREYDRVVPSRNLMPLLETNKKLTHQILLTKYQERIVKEPANALAYFSLGVVHSRMTNVDLAIQAYKHALMLKPDLPDAAFNLASSFQMKGDHKQALNYFEQVLQMSSVHDALVSYAREQIVDLKRDYLGIN